MPQKNVIIEGYDANLKGYCKVDKHQYSFNNVIKDEEVLIDISKDFNKASLVKINKEAKSRVKPLCPLYNKCGGCQLQHIKYDEQLKIKKELIEELYFKKYNKYFEVKDTIGMDNPLRYRNKNQLTFHNVVGGKCRIAYGFYEEFSHRIVDIDSCIIQDKIAEEICSTIKDLMLKMRYNAYDEDRKTGLIRHVLIKRSESTKEIMVVIVTGTNIFPGSQNFVKALVARHKEITTIIHNVNDRKTSVILGDKDKVLYGKGYITDILLGKSFKISAHSFYQVNSVQCAKLYQKAIEIANLSSKDTLVDAYCGVGTIGLIASDKVNKVIGVEIVKDAIDDAIFNAKQNKIRNVHYFCADASVFLKNLASKKEKVDVVVMDPPRSGSDTKFMSSVVKVGAKKIIYISCDPRTQVEDVEYFLNNGYKIDIIQPVDMFPFTKHVETVVLMSRKEK